MANVFDYIFNIGGNFTAQISGMSAAAGKFTAQAEVAESRSKRLAAALASFSYLKDIVQNVTEGITQLSGAGVKLDSQMHDLSAVAGVTGDSLKQIEGFARESAKTFGTDASVAVEGYKLLLSQLSPELGKYPDALREMGDCIQTTSKLMGNDGAAAAEVLTTAMNQFGVSMEDPTAAAEKMGEMMNVMAAAGQAGSAELPAISAAFHVLDKPQEIKEVFSNINNQYSYTDMSKRTENTIYNFSKCFYETRNNFNRIIENNTCFYTFSNVVSPTEKPGDHIFNYLSHPTENSSNNTMNYTEELNSLALTNCSTNLTFTRPNYYSTNNYFNIDNGTNTLNILNEIERFNIGSLNAGIENKRIQRPQENRNRETVSQMCQQNPVTVIERDGLSREDVETIMIEMFRREVELCSY